MLPIAPSGRPHNQARTGEKSTSMDLFPSISISPSLSLPFPPGWVSSGKTCFYRTKGLNWIKPVKNSKNSNVGILWRYKEVLLSAAAVYYLHSPDGSTMQFSTSEVYFCDVVDLWWPHRHSLSDPVCNRPGSILQDDARRCAASGISETGAHSFDVYPGAARRSEQDEWKWRHVLHLPDWHSKADQDKN